MWTRVFPGVYRHAAVPDSPEAREQAALAWAGKDAVLSHRSAAAIWKLDGFERPPKPELTVAGTRHPRSDLVVVHRSRELEFADSCVRGGVRVTRPVRTIIDLASVLDDEELEAAIESARRQRLVSVDRVADQLARIGGAGRPGAAALNSILRALDGRAPCESRLEVKVARLLRQTNLPEPVRQHRVRFFGGSYRLDFVWIALRVALECDGRKFHEFQRSRTRGRHLGAGGWRVLPVTWDDVTRRWPSVVAEISAALADAA